MPVHFVCPQCHRTLSVTRRKIGQAVTCPKCAASVTVPASPGALTGVASPSSMLADLGRFGDADLVDFGDLPESMVDVPGIRAGQGVRPILAKTPAVAQGVPVSRTSIYLQAALLLTIAVVAFGLGYWFGGVDAQQKAESSPAMNSPTMNSPTMNSPTMNSPETESPTMEEGHAL